jgi:WD40 repeat protein
MKGGDPKVLHHENDVTGLSFSPTSDRLVTSSRDRTVKTWSVPEGELLETMREHPDEVRSVIHSPDGSRIASASIDGTVIVRPARGGESQTLTGLLGARVLAFSPDGSLLGVAGIAPRAWVCTLDRPSCRELHGHRAIVRDLVFMPNRDLLATAGGDTTVQIWDLTTAERRILEGHVAPVFDLAPFPSGAYVVSAGGDAVVQMWPVREPPSTETLRAFLDQLTTEVAKESEVARDGE